MQYITAPNPLAATAYCAFVRLCMVLRSATRTPARAGRSALKRMRPRADNTMALNQGAHPSLPPHKPEAVTDGPQASRRHEYIGRHRKQTAHSPTALHGEPTEPTSTRPKGSPGGQDRWDARPSTEVLQRVLHGLCALDAPEPLARPYLVAAEQSAG